VSKKKLLLVVLSLFAMGIRGDSGDAGPLRLLEEADRLAMLYNWPEAAPLYLDAEDRFEKAGDTRNALAARLGYIWVTADSGVVPEIADEVAAYLEDPSIQAEPRLLLRALIAKAMLDRDANELAARESWERILSLAEDLGDRSWEDRAKAELGQILYMDGDLRAASDMFREAITSQYVRLDLGAAMYYTAMVGNGFASAGRPESALQYLNAALRVASLTRDEGFPFLAYQGQARALIALDRHAEAEEVLQESLNRARHERNDFALTQLLVVAGTAAAVSDSTRAIAYLDEAVEISEARGFHHVFAWSTFELAGVYRDAGRLDEAEGLAVRSNAIMRELEDRYHLPQHLALLADVKAQKGEFERADELYAEATDVIDALLVNVNQRQLKASLIETLSEAYVGHFELAATALFDPEKAYEIVERARGRGIADTLRGETESLSSAGGLTADAQQEINRIQTALLHEREPDAREALLDELFRTEQLLSPVRDSVSPLSSGTDRSSPVPLDTLRASLGPDEIVLEYVLGKTQSYALRISGRGIDLFVLAAGRNRIEDLVERYLAAVRSRKDESVVSQQLFSLLLRPVLGDDEVEPESRLIVVADGKLHLLPFDALRDDRDQYVIESHIVTYAPSATVLHLLRTSERPTQLAMNFLGVGDVAYSGTGASAFRGGTAVVDDLGVEFVTAEALPSLPGTGDEVIGVAKVVGGNSTVLLAERATESAFKELPLSDFRIIHLAAHGIADTQFPDRAAIVLGPSPSSTDDGLLQVREIRDLSLHADLVILSACDTGAGRLLGQEGMASLERAFLLAGAKSVIASLWTANDTYTTALMIRVYEYLVRGHDRSSALRQAKIDLLDRFGDEAHPSYWAGFKLVGEGTGRFNAGPQSLADFESGALFD
jgi:CHAT domain-containing protein